MLRSFQRHAGYQLAGSWQLLRIAASRPCTQCLSNPKRWKKTAAIEQPPWKMEGSLIDINTGKLQESHVRPATAQPIQQPFASASEGGPTTDDMEMADDAEIFARPLLVHAQRTANPTPEAEEFAEDETKVLLIQPAFVNARLQSRRTPELQLQEGTGLVEAVSGWKVSDGLIVKIKTKRATTLLTRGKLEEVTEHVQHLKSLDQLDAVVINTLDLSPRQQQNLEDLWNVPVYNRFALILGIFESRATTKEAKLQVELARIGYERARLVLGAESGLDRQRGALSFIGGGGGETKLERDKRKLARRENRIKYLLEQVERQKSVLQAQRDKSQLPVVAVVGYTNAGKTALVRALSGDSELQPEDKLFATLDTATREVKLANGQRVLFIDTVGFVSDLPHSLVDAFKSTLSEIKSANALLVLTDSSDPDRVDQHACVIDVLKQIGLREDLIDNRISLLTKSDLTDRVTGDEDMCDVMPGSSTSKRRDALRLFQQTEAIRFSLTTGEGVAALHRAVSKRLGEAYGSVNVSIQCPLERHDVFDFLQKNSTVVSSTYSEKEKAYLMHVVLTKEDYGRLQQRAGDLL